MVVVADILVYFRFQCLYRSKCAVVEAFRFQHRKKALHRRIVPAVAFARHALGDFGFCQLRAVGAAAVETRLGRSAASAFARPVAPRPATAWWPPFRCWGGAIGGSCGFRGYTGPVSATDTAFGRRI